MDEASGRLVVINLQCRYRSHEKAIQEQPQRVQVIEEELLGEVRLA
jgi:hypothetical protein